MRLALGLVLAGTAWAADARATTPAFEAEIARAKTTIMSDASVGLRHAEAAHADALAETDPRARAIDVATADWLRAEALIGLNQSAKAYVVADAALATVHATAPDTKLEGDLLKARGYASAMSGKVQSALADFQQAFGIFSRAGEPRSEALTLQDIGSIYLDAGDFEHVLAYYRQSAELNVRDPSIMLAAHNNIANALREMKRLPEAAREYQSALVSARELDSAILQVRVLTNLASAQVAAGSLHAAAGNLDHALELADRDPAAAGWKPFIWGVRAQMFEHAGRLVEARDALEQTFRGTAAADTTIAFRDFHETAYRVYSRLGDYRQALEHLEAYKRLDDEGRTLAVNTNSALMSARFDFANQDLKIARLKAGQLQRDVQIGRSTARFHRIVFSVSAVAATLVLAFLLFALVMTRRSRNRVHAANEALSDTNGKLEKALKAKTEFLATTSHEIRTPLNGILGMTQVILADRAMAPPLRERLEVVHSAGQTMRALVDDILDVAKMESGHLTISPAEMSLRQVFVDARKLWSGEAERKKIALSFDLDGCPARVVEDEQRLRQILFNLLSNALKFTESGSVAVRAAAEPGVDGERLVITVRDTGIGIPADRFEDIFESFKQVDGGTTRKFGGTGLGLAISRNLATAMHGTIDVESVLDSGSTFRVDLPLVRAEGDAAVDGGADAPAPATLAEAAVLLVERNPLTQSLLRALVQPHCRRLDAVASADDAAAWLAESGADLVLADAASLAEAPDAQGAAVAALAAARPAARLVVLAAGLDEARAAELEASGAASAIAKPVAGPVLLARLRTAIATNGVAAAQSPLSASEAA